MLALPSLRRFLHSSWPALQSAQLRRMLEQKPGLQLLETTWRPAAAPDLPSGGAPPSERQREQQRRHDEDMALCQAFRLRLHHRWVGGSAGGTEGSAGAGREGHTAGCLLLDQQAGTTGALQPGGLSRVPMAPTQHACASVCSLASESVAVPQASLFEWDAEQALLAALQPGT